MTDHSAVLRERVRNLVKTIERFKSKTAAPADLANAIIEGSGRRVDWMHIPLLDSTDDAFFAPLAKLRPGSTRIHLGAIHNMERFGARVAAARKYLPEFGVAAFCGFGRMPPADMPKVLAEHLKAMEGVGKRSVAVWASGSARGSAAGY